jgi:PiT family inorganic phosphate transporter
MLELLLSFGMAFYVAWSIGANDETMALLAGSGFTKVGVAVLVGALMVFLGSVFLGQPVEETIGKKMLLSAVSPSDVLMLMFSVAAWLTIASYRGWPVSTTHSVIGAVIGLGIIRGVDQINWGSLTNVAAAWLLSPLIGLAGCMIINKILTHFLRRHRLGLAREIKIARFSAMMLLIWSCFTAFSRGANDIGNATALISAVYGNPLMIRLMGGLAMAFGLLILGTRVTKSVGLNLVNLNPTTALSAQIAIALTVFIGTVFGLPLSGTHILVGAVIGVGLHKKIWINVKGLGEILSMWVFTFFGSAAIFIATFLAVGNFSVLL